MLAGSSRYERCFWDLRFFLNINFPRSCFADTEASALSEDIHLRTEGDTAGSHGDSNYRKILTSELETTNTNMFPGKDVTPEETSQGCTEGDAICTVVYTEGHTVHSRPECTITDRPVDLDPCLNHAR